MAKIVFDLEKIYPKFLKKILPEQKFQTELFQNLIR